MTVVYHSLGLVVTLGLIPGCYSATLDPNALGVYICEEDIDCAKGSTCIEGLCDDLNQTQRARIRVSEPPELGVFPLGSAQKIPLVIEGQGISLTSTLTDEVDAGYIEVLLDGAVVDTITDGELESGIALDSIDFPSTAGLHHIGLVARRLDGTLFEGESARFSMGFWLDDGNEHVGILKPAPGSTVELGDSEGLTIEVASLNFAFANPGFVSVGDISLGQLGYVRVFVDADVPDCLPMCNFDDQLPMVPPGLSRVNRMLSEQVLELPEMIGTVRIQAVAQTLSNTPYQRDNGSGEIVFYSVPVQSIATKEQP